MDQQQQFVELLHQTPLVDEAFAKITELFQEKIRTVIDAGCLHLELPWTEDDINELHAEARVGLISKIQVWQDSYEQGDISETEFNKLAVGFHDELIHFLADFIQNWVEIYGKQRYKNVLRLRGISNRREEEMLRRNAQSWTDRLRAKRKLRKRIDSIVRSTVPVRETHFDDYDYEEDFFDDRFGW